MLTDQVFIALNLSDGNDVIAASKVDARCVVKFEDANVDGKSVAYQGDSVLAVAGSKVYCSVALTLMLLVKTTLYVIT